MTRMTPERRAVIELLQASEEATPQEIATALGRSPGSTRQLLSGMLDDELVITRGRGRYSLPADANPDELTPNPDEPTRQADNADVTPDIPDDSPDVGESRIPKPRAGVIGAYSVADGGMISNEEHWRRKGYR